MKTRILLPAFAVLLLACSAASAEEQQTDGSVVILEPADGAIVPTHAPITVRWQAVWGPDGNHLHLYLDHRMLDIERAANGTDAINILFAGKHKICLAIETRWHFPTGVRTCIEVTAKHEETAK